MALTQEELQKLKNAKFIELYNAEKPYWDDTTREAYRYALKILPKDARIRPDDVREVLTLTIRQNTKFIEYCQKHKSTQQYWCRYFTNFLIDIYFLEHRTRGEKRGKKR